MTLRSSTEPLPDVRLSIDSNRLTLPSELRFFDLNGESLHITLTKILELPSASYSYLALWIRWYPSSSWVS